MVSGCFGWFQVVSGGFEWFQVSSITPIDTGRPTTFEFSDLGVGHLCSTNNNQWCSMVYRVLDQQRLF